MATTSLGRLTLDLVAQIAGFEQGMDKAARITDKRSKEMVASAKKLGKEMGLALSAIGGVALAGFTKYVQNTIEAEKVQAQLAARIRDTGGAAQRSVEQLNAHADALQRATTFDDEAIGSVQAMLLTFKEIQGVNFDDATAAVLDLSTAMGTDAQSAALQLGKALNDPVKGLSALGRAGVQFSESQKKLIKDMVEAGDVAGAQRVILAELEGQMGTAAEAARNTLGGALQGLQNNFDNLLEGDTDGAGLKGTVDAINDLSDSLNDPSLKSGIDTLAGGFLRIGANAIEAAANFGGFLSGLNKVLANAGVVPGDDIKQLEARRKAIAERGADSVIGRLFPDAVKEELAKIDKEIAAFPFRNVVGSVSGAQTPRPRSGGGDEDGKKGRERKARELPDFAKDAADELRRMVDLEADARKAFDAMAASLSGPLQEAMYQYGQDQERLNELARAGAIDSESLAKAQADLRKEHEANVKAINAQLTPAQEYIEALKEENTYLLANEEGQLRMTAARYAGADATKAQIDEAYELLRVNEQLAESTRNWDELNSNISDGLFDIISGAESAGDAVENFLDRLNAQILSNITDDWAKSLTDFFKGFASGQSGGGSSGAGFWASILGAFGFGGQRASGGDVLPNRFYEVGEQDRPELLMARNGKQYLIPGNQGQIVPMGSSNRSVSVTQVFPGVVMADRRSDSQRAAEAGRKIRMAARNG